MSNEIESVKPALTVILDDGDFIINSTGLIGKQMLQAVLPLAAGAHKITVISDGEMKVLKKAAGNGTNHSIPAIPSARPKPQIFAGEAPEPDMQDAFISALESGATGEKATGEAPSPTPGPNDPVVVPAPKKRKPVIFQDAAAPPAPELAEAEMDRLLAEAEQAEREASRVVEDRRFQTQQAIQAGQEPVADPVEAEAAATPRRARRERALATTGRPCGRCGGGGRIVGDAGFTGACPVCHGEGTVKTWDRSLKVR